MLDVTLGPNDKIDFIQSKNMKFGYSIKLCHMQIIGGSRGCARCTRHFFGNAKLYVGYNFACVQHTKLYPHGVLQF